MRLILTVDALTHFCSTSLCPFIALWSECYSFHFIRVINIYIWFIALVWLILTIDALAHFLLNFVVSFHCVVIRMLFFSFHKTNQCRQLTHCSCVRNFSSFSLPIAMHTNASSFKIHLRCSKPTLRVQLKMNIIFWCSIRKKHFSKNVLGLLKNWIRMF